MAITVTLILALIIMNIKIYRDTIDRYGGNMFKTISKKTKIYSIMIAVLFSTILTGCYMHPPSGVGIYIPPVGVNVYTPPHHYGGPHHRPHHWHRRGPHHRHW